MTNGRIDRPRERRILELAELELVTVMPCKDRLLSKRSVSSDWSREPRVKTRRISSRGPQPGIGYDRQLAINRSEMGSAG